MRYAQQRRTIRFRLNWHQKCDILDFLHSMVEGGLACIVWMSLSLEVVSLTGIAQFENGEGSFTTCHGCSPDAFYLRTFSSALPH